MKLTYAFMLTIIGLVVSVQSQCFTNVGINQPHNHGARQNLYKGQQAFTLSLLDAINKATPNENIFFSPYSTYHALLLAYFGAGNKTEESLRKTLYLNWAGNKFDVLKAYRYEIQNRAKRARNSSIEFISADKIFTAKEVELSECVSNALHDELESKDFLNNAENSRTDINKWIEDVTRGHIKDILVPGSITAQTKLVLANAAYFKGQWASKFDPKQTSPQLFYYEDTSKKEFVDMMYKSGQFNFASSEQLKAYLLEIPYLGDGSDISMIIILPPSGPNNLANTLSLLNPDSLKNALDYLMPREVELKLPKFAFEKTLEFRPILEKLGVGNLFDSTANLSVFSNKTQLNFDDAIHKAKIIVDEEGSTAAAATVLFSFRSSRPLDPVQFHCSHPFIFMIYDHKSDAILFSGIYRVPEK